MAGKSFLDRIFGKSDNGYGAEKGSDREASIKRTEKATKAHNKKTGRKKTFGLIESMLKKRNK